MRFVLFCWLAFHCAIASSAPGNWPSWRGPDGNAVAPATSYPAEINESTLAWRVDLPGEGSSTPIVWGESLFLTATDGEQEVVCCYSADGQQQWEHRLTGADAAKHRNATGSNPSPVCDADYVVAYFKSGDVVCLTHAGEELWRVNLQQEYGADTLWWDLGTSPVLTRAGVLIAVIQEKGAYLVTLDLKSGQEVWRVKRDYQRPPESDHAYTTPSVVRQAGREVVVTWGADHLTGHDADDGALLWECGGFNPQDKKNQRVIASATVVDGVAYVQYDRGAQLAAVDVAADGNVSQEDRWLWLQERVGADVPTPVVWGGSIFILGDRGELACVDAKNGEELWTKRLPRSSRKYYSSPLYAAGRVYCVREDGAVFVVSTGDQGEAIAEGDLGDETVATPTPWGQSLVFRTRGQLLRYDHAAEPAPQE